MILVLQQIAALLLLVLPGLLPAIALFPGWRGVLFAPLVTIAAVAFGAVLALAIPAPPLVIGIVILIGLQVFAWGHGSPRGRITVEQIREAFRLGPQAWLALSAGLVSQWIGTITPATAFDARITWFLHAHWLVGGQGALLSGLRDPAVAYNPDYPPAGSTVIALVWRTLGTRDVELAQFVSATCTGVALSFALVLLTDLRTSGPWRSLGRFDRWLFPVLMGAAAYSATQYFGFNGYMDGFVACVSLCLVLLLFRVGVHPLALALVAAVVALTKNEGFVFVGLVSVLSTVVGSLRHRLGRSGLLAVWSGPVVGAIWIAMVRIRGANSWYSISSVSSALTTDDDSGSRASIASLAVGKQILGAVVVLAGSVALAGLARKRPQPASDLAPRQYWNLVRHAGVMFVLAIAISVVTIGYFVASAAPIRPFLGGSVERVTMTPKLLLLAAALLVFPGEWLLGSKQRHRFAALLVAFPLALQGARFGGAPFRPEALRQALALNREGDCLERQVRKALPARSVVAVDIDGPWRHRIISMAYPRYRLVPLDSLPNGSEVRILRLAPRSGNCGRIVVADPGTSANSGPADDDVAS